MWPGHSVISSTSQLHTVYSASSRSPAAAAAVVSHLLLQLLLELLLLLLLLQAVILLQSTSLWLPYRQYFSLQLSLLFQDSPISSSPPTPPPPHPRQPQPQPHPTLGFLLPSLVSSTRLLTHPPTHPFTHPLTPSLLPPKRANRPAAVCVSSPLWTMYSVLSMKELMHPKGSPSLWFKLLVVRL